MTDESDPISTADLIGDFLPPDWDNSPSRESQIQAVVHAFLTKTNLFDDQLEAGSVYGLLCTDSVGTETDHIEMIRHWDAGFMQGLF